MKSIKLTFDPNNVLNPGKLFLKVVIYIYIIAVLTLPVGAMPLFFTSVILLDQVLQHHQLDRTNGYQLFCQHYVGL